MINIERALTVEGWMSHAELTWLAEQAEQSSRILEVGSYKGRSARALGDNTSGVVYCIDPWNGAYYNDDGTVSTYINTDVFDVFKHNLSDLLAALKVVPFKQPFHEFYTTLKFDMIFIDGDHRYEELQRDIHHACKLLKPYGMLCGHDYNMPGWPSVMKVVDEIFEHVDSVDYIWYKVIP